MYVSRKAANAKEKAVIEPCSYATLELLIVSI